MIHPDDVTILFLDYDVIIFVDVNPLGYCDVINAPTPLFQYRPFPTTQDCMLSKRRKDENLGGYTQIFENLLISTDCTILTDVGEFWNSNKETSIRFTVKINREHGKLSL